MSVIEDFAKQLKNEVISLMNEKILMKLL